MTSLEFTGWQPLTSGINFRFQFDCADVLRRSESLCTEFDKKISQSKAEL